MWPIQGKWGSAMRLKLKKPLERAIHGGHPWVYRDALHRTDADPGTEATLFDRRGRFLAQGLTDSGPIGLRIWSLAQRPVDAALLGERFAAARALRTQLFAADTTAYRIVHGEGDRMPGVVCDRYGPFLVLKFDGAGAVSRQHELLSAIEAASYDNVLVRTGRGPDKTVKTLLGNLPIPDELVVQEHGMHLPVSLLHGQKTGLFLDHRESRFRIRGVSRGLRVLNLYGYTGGFSIAAAMGGAKEVTTVDTAAAALTLAERGFELNEIDPARHRTVAQDVFEFLQQDGHTKTWDLIVSDPPSFAPNAKSVPKALAAYQRLHHACLERVTPGGLMLCASCSSHIMPADFLTSIRLPAKTLGRPLQLLGSWGAAMDHPTLPMFPEGDYLKAMLFRVG